MPRLVGRIPGILKRGGGEIQAINLPRTQSPPGQGVLADVTLQMLKPQTRYAAFGKMGFKNRKIAQDDR